MKLLYQAEVAGGVPDLAKGSSSLEEFGEATEKAREFALELAGGVVARRAELDAALGEVMDKWEPGRLAAVDAQILRLAAYELLFCPDIPGRVSINEALDIGREYSTAESVSFMNGVLDALATKKAPGKLA
jgi:N utilization substance protein B